MIKGVKGYIMNIALIVAISAFSIYISVGKEFKSVFKTVFHARPGWLLFLAVWMLCYYITDGISMWIAGKAYNSKYTKKQGFVTGIVGTFFSGITPSSTGGQFAQIFLYNNQGIPPAASSGILMGCFIAYQIVIIGYATTIMIVHSAYYLTLGEEILGMAMFGFAINLGVALVLFIGARSDKFQTFLIRRVVFLLSKTPFVKNYEATSAKIETFFADFRHQLDRLMLNKSMLFKICVCDVIKLTIMYCTPFFACKSLGIEVHMNQFVEFIALASVIHLINAFLPIPGASGGSEGCFMILFGFLGRANASSAMLVWRFSQFYYGMILGFITFLVSKDTKSQKPVETQPIRD
ncbi:MAG: flippase-like domain-containing protein [Erysipelotrichaceae bacterium]|nr:flippase-like domain-containing protein [Erysipelotrichaceae bacterium]